MPKVKIGYPILREGLEVEFESPINQMAGYINEIIKITSHDDIFKHIKWRLSASTKIDRLELEELFETEEDARIFLEFNIANEHDWESRFNTYFPGISTGDWDDITWHFDPVEI